MNTNECTALISTLFNISINKIILEDHSMHAVLMVSATINILFCLLMSGERN